MVDTPNTANLNLSDAFKKGVQKQWGHETIYLNPNKIDLKLLQKDIDKNEREAIGLHTAKQIDANNKEISVLFDHDTLADLTKKTIRDGPFAQKVPNDDTVCIISPPKKDEFNPSQVYSFFDITDHFSLKHLVPLPGTQEDWEQLIGEHEGEHCNQERVYMNDSNYNAKKLDGEIRSDRAALATLRANGKHDVADAMIAIRILAASNGGASHATSIFLSSPDYTGVTQEHYEAAERFTNEMLLTVCADSNLSMDDAAKLRSSDPQKFVKTLEKAIENGHYPALRYIDDEKIMQMIADKMGLSHEDFKSLDGKRVNEINAHYKAMDKEDKFLDRGEANPHIETYINQYIAVTKKYFIADTKPVAATPAPTTAQKHIQQQGVMT